MLRHSPGPPMHRCATSAGQLHVPYPSQTFRPMLQGPLPLAFQRNPRPPPSTMDRRVQSSRKSPEKARVLLPGVTDDVDLTKAKVSCAVGVAEHRERPRQLLGQPTPRRRHLEGHLTRSHLRENTDAHVIPAASRRFPKSPSGAAAFTVHPLSLARARTPTRTTSAPRRAQCASQR